MKLKPSLSYSEFYITNVCNLNCEECNRFNNYHFKGHQKWSDYEEDYKEWGKHINLDYVTILGGEPLLNPTINEWIKGIRSIWKEPTIEITTNGYRLNYVKNLYETVRDNNVFFHVSIHNQKDFEKIEEFIFDFLKDAEKKTIIPDDIDERWKSQYRRFEKDGLGCDSYKDFENLPEEQKKVCIENGLNDKDFLKFNTYYEYKDNNGVLILVYIEDMFYHSAVQKIDNKFVLHNSDVDTAHKRCYGKFNHHFIKGKLYKCAISGVLPMFVEQFNFDMTKEDYDLLHSYKPLSLDNIDEIDKFLEEIKNPIPQCKFCPDGLGESFKLKAVSGNKIKVEQV